MSTRPVRESQANESQTVWRNGDNEGREENSRVRNKKCGKQHEKRNDVKGVEGTESGRRRRERGQIGCRRWPHSYSVEHEKDRLLEGTTG